MFDRRKELKKLKERMHSGKSELIIIYGRRGLGKTTLVLEAMKGEKSLYLFTLRGSIDDVLSAYSDNIEEYIGIRTRFSNWREFLSFLYDLGKEGYVVAIDEFQRLSEAYAPSISLLQDWWDRKIRNTKLVLILVGSLVGMVERLALAGDSPLFGRRTMEMKIKPIGFLDMFNYWKDYSLEDRVVAYGIFGGTPNYFSSVPRSASPLDNVKEFILDRNGKLAREPENLLNEETRSPATYMSILSNLARSGRGLPLSKIHVRRGSPTVYLNTLLKMDLVERVESLSGAGSIYRISDEFFRFWFYFIYPRIGIIESGKGEVLLDYIRENLPEYLSLTFEKILWELLIESSGRSLKGMEIPIIERIGGYWRGDVEVDVAAIGEKTLIIGEAKWREERVERREVDKLIVKAGYIAQKLGVSSFQCIMLSKTGYKENAKKLEGDNLVLLDLEDIKDIAMKRNT